MGSSDSPPPSSSSLSAFLATFIPVAIQAGAFFLVFLFLRSRMKRVYRPRTFLSIVPEPCRTQDLPQGRFNWLSPFKNLPDEYVLNHQSLDGYLYLRFLKMLTLICFVGCLITWPVLFPVNATAAGGKTQFDLLSFSNITKQQKSRYYAHVFIAWIFFSFVMFIVTRETIYFINLRNAYLMSPFNAARISARTVLFTDVPADYLQLEKLHALFGATIRRAWLTTDCKDLDADVENRDKTALKLEGAEIKLSKQANKRRLKAEKAAQKGKKTPAAPQGEKGAAPVAPAAAPGADVEAGPVTSEYLIKKDRPTHRLGKIPFIGKKVDTIEWSRSELKTLVPKIANEQSTLRKGDGKLLPAVFIEFTTQQAAQAAYRRMSARRAPRMYPRAISATPDQIIWKNLKIKKTERAGRKVATNTFLTLMIIFWAIPVAIVGAISNINYLTDKVHFLRFITHIPKPILGVVTGLLPSVLLSVLMSLVPVVCRCKSPHPLTVKVPPANLLRRDGKAQWRGHPPSRGTAHPALVHGLPGGAGLPHHHICLGGVSRRNQDHRLSRKRHDPPGSELACCVQLLHLLPHRARSRHSGWEPPEHWRPGHVDLGGQVPRFVAAEAVQALHHLGRSRLGIAVPPVRKLGNNWLDPRSNLSCAFLTSFQLSPTRSFPLSSSVSPLSPLRCSTLPSATTLSSC
jgi:hypothetical protein